MRFRAAIATAALAGTLAVAGCGERAPDDASSGGAGDAADATGTTSPATGTTGAVGAIPDDFPLADGMGGPQDTIVTSRSGTGLRDLTLCGTTPLRGLPTRDRMVADNSGGEAADTRELVLLGDPGQAAALATTISELPTTCGATETSGRTETTTEVRRSPFGPSPAATLVQTYTLDGEPGPGATIIQVVPAGAALLATSTYGEWGADDLEAQISSTAEPLARTVASLAVFADQAASPSTPSSTPSPASTGAAATIPADFPLGVGLPDGDGETEVSPPSADGDGMGEVEMCGRVVWPHARGVEVGPTERLVTSALGPEYFDARELIVHEDADAAVEGMAALRQAAEECRSLDNQVWTDLERDTGYDTVTMGLTYDDGLGSSVFQVTRVGSARLMVQTYGEGSLASLGSQADGVTETTGQIVSAMCAFTKTGC
ncbi:hypothetical protein [Nocardioides hwasunensis]|uniref:Sensor domain-containing protein n=1 Tax=Nocardioides hwasunensis TaxID=397258 RepID=A0ABR8MDE8_9ACTN|nr:hypothetical protein [Nocardioides hwasunensis]MBD3914150.1 hypothetical protein [Nocardioides hwasunensis]